MNALSKTERRDVANFDPKQTRNEDAKADSLIEFSRRVHDWPLLETAVDHKMAEQEEFVRWWRENVTKNKGGDRRSDQKRRAAFLVVDAESETGITQQQVSKWAKRLKDKNKYREALYGAAYRKAMAERGQTDQRGASGTGVNEWYTPAKYIQLARDVLSGIDVDPASNLAAQETVRAKTYFTSEDDGLSQDWEGSVWLNPPYAQPLIAQFVSKMVAERRAGHVTAGIMLTHNYTDTAWFHEASGLADAICFTRGRIRFVDDQGNEASPTQGQAFFYYGDDVELFASVFGEIGLVVTPCTGEVA